MGLRVRRFLSVNRSYIFLVLLLFLIIKTLVPQLDDLWESLIALKDANPYWILISIIVFFTGVPICAFQIRAIALKPIPYFLTFKVEMAGQFVSKLLPSFVGMVTLNMYYLVKKKHTVNQAATVMTVNSLTSGTAYAILIVLSLAFSTVSLAGAHGSFHIPPNLIYFIVILLAGFAFILVRSMRLRARLKSIWHELAGNLIVYKQKPFELATAVLCNGAGSAANIFVLFAAAQSIDINLSFAGALLAYTFGNIAMTLVPTPGGLGAAEAGIYSGLVLAGVPGADAVTITLLYRLITFWLPAVPGYVFFWGLRKNVLADFSIKKRYVG